MIERHFDYVFNYGTLAAGAVTSPIQMRTDTDAPFVLRCMGGYYWDPSDELPVTLPPFLLMRFCDPDYNWLQTLNTPGLLAQQQPAVYNPLRRHIVYPAQASIQFVLENALATSIPNITLIFRGVKLFPGDQHTAPVYAPTYPDCYTQRDFQYEASLALTAGQTVRNNFLYINGDADFAWRTTTMQNTESTANVSFDTTELLFRDMNLKAYASDFIRAAWLCGTQASRPPLWYPELYIAKGKQFVYDARNVSTMGAVTDMQISLNGAKVFRKG